jgi:protein-tyrosine phosphatase
MIEDRVLNIEVAHNVRHLAGYKTKKGADTAARDIVRSASLHKLTDAGIGSLYDHGIRVIVDLRSPLELERDVTPPTDKHGIRNVHAPVFQNDASPAGLGQDKFPGYAFVYQRFLEIGQPAYRTLFETVANTDGGVLFHCAAGKDRTGVAAAILLDLAETDDDHIIADYRQTEELLKPLWPEWLPRMAERGVTEERAAELLGAPEDAIRTAVSTLRETYGGAEGYLRHLGLSEASISAVKARMVD